MTATLTTHRCPVCALDVQVYARDATVWHSCPRVGGAGRMVRFEIVEVRP